MLSFENARRLCFKAGGQRYLKKETIPLAKAVRRVLAEDIVAPIALQPFDNSAMDGYGVNHPQLAAASTSTPVALRLVETIFAGDAENTPSFDSRSCLAVMTGAPTPPGVNAVVPRELASRQNNIVTFTEPVAPHANIRKAGEDFRAGAPVLKMGTKLDLKHLLPLASLGVSHVGVYKKPHVAFITMGNELVNDLSHPLEAGQIYNANRLYGEEALRRMGCSVDSYAIKDEESVYEDLVIKLLDQEVDVIVSSGSVSEGDKDFIPGSLQRLKATQAYHKITLRPGKPNLLAYWEEGPVYVGLPGNPVSTAVGFDFLVRAVLCGLQKNPLPSYKKGRLKNTTRKKEDFTFILKAAGRSGDLGLFEAEVLEGQASFMTHPFLHMNGWVIVPEGVEMVEQGTLVDFFSGLAGTAL